MAKRTFSTIALWLIILGTLWFFGTRGAAVLAIVVSVLTQLELYRMLRRMGHAPFIGIGLLFGALIVIAPLIPHYTQAILASGTQAILDSAASGPPPPPSMEKLVVAARLTRFFTPANLLALAAIACALLLPGRRTPENRVESLGWTLFGLVYVPFLLQFLIKILLIAQPHASTGLVLGLWVIATSKFCDVGALLAGMAFGKHKMAPVISPKKTWEGAAGGVVTSALVGAGIAYFCRQWLPVTFTPLLAAAMAVPIAILGIVSDLVESIIKRRADTKDSGATIPGIGGIFDLSDSLLLTAPAAYILFTLILLL